MLIACKEQHKPSRVAKQEQIFKSLRRVDSEIIEIDMDTLANFKTVVNILETIDCRKNYAVFKLENKEKVLKIQPLHFCGDIFDYRLRDIIYIDTDSITVNYKLKYPIDSLKIILNYHLLNPNNDKNYPKKHKGKLISINVDGKKNIIDTKKLLFKITNHIDNLKTKNKVRFMFENRGIMPEIIFAD